jgi:hypothetical protein
MKPSSGDILDNYLGLGETAWALTVAHYPYTQFTSLVSVSEIYKTIGCELGM